VGLTIRGALAPARHQTLWLIRAAGIYVPCVGAGGGLQTCMVFRIGLIGRWKRLL
jgi:hypothetical protein